MLKYNEHHKEQSSVNSNEQRTGNMLKGSVADAGTPPVPPSHHDIGAALNSQLPAAHPISGPEMPGNYHHCRGNA